MIFPDYHFHTSFSSDCNTSLTDIIAFAKKEGMTSLCVTDHFDMDFPVRRDEPHMDFQLDMKEYYKTYQYLQHQLGEAFDLRIGVELGIMPSTTKKLTAFVKENPQLDFIICSLHLVDNKDPYYPDFFEGKTDEEAYLGYFETLLHCVKEFQDFNVCGHLDYVVRYGATKAANFHIGDYADIFSELFRILVENGKGIEINTGSLYRGLSFPHPHPDILQMYKDAGGEIVTIGSDAHDVSHIGYGFDVARSVLLEKGFRYYTTFKNQQPTFHKIN